ncbi:translation initiation factor IF-2 [Mitsuokella multacida]|uniref:translation initiation factor IF-2 n=1 Tax=Mitsuokella multacida TaxID=52226 RepID=UPI0026DFA55D|nr:translation initiation factor IF-2 [Mitsuokella multacida]
MSKYRVYELAKEFNTDSKVILDILKRNKFKAANNFSSVGEEERTAIKNSLSNKGAKPQAKAPAAPAAQKPAAKPVEKRAAKPQAGKQNHGNSGSNGNNGRTERNERNERRSDAGRNNGNGNHNGGNRAASGSNRPSHNSGGNSGNNGGNRNSNGGGNNNRGGNRNDRRNSSRNERGGRNDRNDRNNRFGSKNDRNRRGRNNKRGGQQAPKVEIAHPKHIKLPETIAVKDLASKMSYTAAEVVKKLFMMGVMATINQEIDFDTAALVASEFGVTCEELPPEVDPTEIPEIEDDPKTLKLRPPVVTVMGHVDHGKTSLLDCIRNTHVQTHEAGGITQHIGAYQVNCKGKKIVFLDTPGHEAFTAMRARGAQITDIAILVVAADDGVMPQTIEAIHHAKSAGVPIIVAINKIDKPGANPDRVKQELMEQGLVPEEYGGDTIMVPVSAKKQIGIDDLLEMVLLVAEVKELKANPNRDARGVIVEAKLDKGRGPVATVLVQNGTLRIGDSVVCGTTYGKVRAMVNDRGENVKKAGPSVPVEILGLNDVPEAGDILAVLEEKQARSIAEARIERQRNNLIKSKKVSLDDLFHQIQEGDIKDLNIVIKADVQGSVEALSSSLLKLNKNDEVRVSIVHSGVGAVNESDVMLASASNALIIAFNVRPDANARKLADTENIDIRTYRVIYDAINDVKDAMSGMLKPKYKEVIQGRVEIRQVMKFSKALVAGSYVLEGKICNNSKIRIIRDNIEIFDGEIDSLRRFKDEVKEVNAGYECGISIVDFRDFKEGDIIEAYTMEEIATTIADANKAAAKKREEEAKAAAAKAKENAKD